jgi:hypothetical protein
LSVNDSPSSERSVTSRPVMKGVVLQTLVIAASGVWLGYGVFDNWHWQNVEKNWASTDGTIEAAYVHETMGRHVTELGGTAVGSGIGLEAAVSPLSRGQSPQQTLTQAELADVFPQNDLTSAPGQEGGAVRYRLFTVNEAQQVFSAVERAQSAAQGHLRPTASGSSRPILSKKSCSG